MILHDEHNLPLVINSLTSNIKTRYVWTLNLKEMDFTLHNMKVLEEYTGPSLTLKINDRLLSLPCHWNILICDPETTQLDAARVSDLAGDSYHALGYSNRSNMPMFLPIQVIDYHVEESHVYPTHSRHLMICHDVGESKWICCSYTDSYNRFLKNKIAGDLIEY